MVKIGQNAGVLASKTQLDFYVGSKVAAFRRALRELEDAKALLDQVSDAELVALGYADGTNNTPNETGYLRSSLVTAPEVRKFITGQAATPADHDYAMRYVAAAS